MEEFWKAEFQSLIILTIYFGIGLFLASLCIAVMAKNKNLRSITQIDSGELLIVFIGVGVLWPLVLILILFLAIAELLFKCIKGK